jgi:DNA-binding transcriptional regulator GbsR (MarR family)
MPDFEQRVLGTFAAVARSLGYSDVHGRIIASLLVAGKPLSLQEMAKKTGYSLAAISLSMDLLELVGIIRKVKNPHDRKLYARLEGDVLQGLKNALMFKIQKEIVSTLAEFDNYRGDKRYKRTVDVLEKEIKRLEKYIDDLSKVELPKA